MMGADLVLVPRAALDALRENLERVNALLAQQRADLQLLKPLPERLARPSAKDDLLRECLAALNRSENVSLCADIERVLGGK